MVLAFDDPRGLALHCTVMHFSNFVSLVSLDMFLGTQLLEAL